MEHDQSSNTDTSESSSLETVAARGLLAGELSRGRTRRKFVQGAVAGAGGIVAAGYVKPSLRSLGVPAALASVSGALGSPEKPIDTGGPGDTTLPPGSPQGPGGHDTTGSVPQTDQTTPPGSPGSPGTPGAPGTSGPGGESGTNGPGGAPGTNGPGGAPGTNGPAGAPGTNGPGGAPGPTSSTSLPGAPASAGGTTPGQKTPGQPEALSPQQANAPGMEVAGISAEAPVALRPAMLPGSAPSPIEARPAQLPRAGDWGATPAPVALGALLVGGGLVARFSGWLGKRKSTDSPLEAPTTTDSPTLDN